MKKARILSLSLVALSLVLLALARVLPNIPGDTVRQAHKVERRLERKAARLDRLMQEALEQDATQWLDMSPKLPQGMVIYRYVEDSLQSWCGSFPVANDDISGKMVVERLVGLRVNLRSPLADAGEQYSYVNLGPDWYLLKCMQKGFVKVIGGIKVCSVDDFGPSGLSGPPAMHARPGRALRLAEHYPICPLSFSGGSVVSVQGVPQFKILYDLLDGTPSANALLVWLALAAFIAGGLVLAFSERTLQASLLASAGYLVAIAAVYFWGRNVDPSNLLFSPQLYSDGPVLYSLGAILCINFAITLTVASLYAAREDICSRIGTRAGLVLLGVVATVAAAAVLFYAFWSLASIILHSHISLEIYKIVSVSRFTALVYFAYIVLLFCVPMLIQTLQPALPKVSGLHINVFSPVGRLVWALLISAGIAGTSAAMGLQLESRIMERMAFMDDAQGPQIFSAATYNAGERVSYRGNYSYPTKLTDSEYRLFYEEHATRLTAGGYRHFVYYFAPGQIMVVSRPRVKVVTYALTILCVALLVLVLLLPFSRSKPRRSRQDRHYFKSRISLVVTVSLILTMATISIVSVLFVSARSDANLRSAMSDKLGSLQTFVQSGLNGIRFTDELRTQNTVNLLNGANRNFGTGVSLYDAKGSLLLSAEPGDFERRQNRARMSGTAYNQIINNNKGSWFEKMDPGVRMQYGMYAPIQSPSGEIIAILFAPYRGSNANLEYDAVAHSIAIISVFVILLLLAKAMSGAVIDRMFKPLDEMGRKMATADINSFELINYKGQDEITGLVEAYNRMVKVVGESTRQLAIAERDKAWSGMARQVAHEIKNPLTPMKLQVQRMIRLKQKGDPQWDEKFDEAARILLEHIDILSDTAREFSTFANLYTEESTSIDIDKLIQEELSMFDSTLGVRFEYMGLEGATISGPRPQLTRVLVNLVNNAVQAVEQTQDAVVRVSLRNGTEAGFVEIVVEDNGPGVSDDNVQRLFTPNFTTKSGGSGLGLAISRSVLDKCGATIRYSRSFSLGGACFTILYPKN